MIDLFKYDAQERKRCAPAPLQIYNKTSNSIQVIVSTLGCLNKNTGET